LNRRYNKIYYWKNKKQQEVDFVIKKKKVIEAIQVCWDIEKPKSKEREIKILVEACKELKLKEGLILTEDMEKEEKIEGVNISIKPIWKWLLEN